MGVRLLQQIGIVKKLGLVSVLGLILNGCNTVEFHEKELFNDRLLQFDPDPLSSEMRQHMITPREGTIGGFSPVGAGGCSCK